MAKFRRNTVILAKLETTVGTDAVPTGAANAIAIRNYDHRPLEGESTTREILRGSFGSDAIILQNQYAEVTFEVELAGSGAAGTAPPFSSLLRACGMTETIVASTSVTYGLETPVT